MRTATDQLWKLLPPASSDLERDILSATPFDGTLDPVVPRISLSKLVDIPYNYLPWLIIEYGLGNLQEFLEDSRQLIAEGLALRMERGTPAALKRVMRWLGLEVLVIEEATPGLHGYEYQLDIGLVPDDLAIISRIAKLARIVAPARSRLRRIFHDLNRPMFVWDETEWDVHIWDNYGGVWSGDIAGIVDPAPNVWLSFERFYAGRAAYGGASVIGKHVAQPLVDLDFGIYIGDPDGYIAIQSGGLVIDPSSPSVDGDLSIGGDVGIDTTT